MIHHALLPLIIAREVPLQRADDTRDKTRTRTRLLFFLSGTYWEREKLDLVVVLVSCGWKRRLRATRKRHCQ